VSPKEYQAWLERRELLEARLRDADDLEPELVAALEEELAQIRRILAKAGRD
jgi:hypothetical protein